MTTLIEYNLPAATTGQWLTDSLRRGPSLSLAKLIANTSDWSGFSFKTAANEGLSETDLLGFSAGNKASGQRADDWLMNLLATSALTLQGLFVVEDWRATPRSQFLADMSLPAIFVGEEVYFVLRERDPRRIDNWRRIFSNTVPTFHAFLVDDDPRVMTGTSISATELADMARRLRMIICGAYDGESFVVGTKE
jgi:hypothetical protein